MAADTQRLFFSLWPDASVRQQISKAAEALVNAGQGRVLSPENYHITLAFLGAVPNAQIADVVAAARTVRFSSFTIELERTGYLAKSLVVMPNLQRCPAPLARLVNELWHALMPLGFSPDSRTYKPHVSLARRVPAEECAALAEPIEWAASEFVLIASETRLSGSVYTLLEHFPAGD